ncbi:hypothetical protein E2C01_054586 [Portunus trituberculatus]|uniref:Uncharacterized protein n=1 Tax=Portunus trituberculatus TaxID=210409 RepID=A0A5B7GU41_PORTR|nr:hypothetical protein [Portunus trituberculatus]
MRNLPTTYGDRERWQLMSSPVGPHLFDGHTLAAMEQRELESSQRSLVSQIAHGLASSAQGVRAKAVGAIGSRHLAQVASPLVLPPPAPKGSAPLKHACGVSSVQGGLDRHSALEAAVSGMLIKGAIEPMFLLAKAPPVSLWRSLLGHLVSLARLVPASLRDVSLKTVFLLALASSHRVSGLHSLSAEMRHSKGWTSMTFSFAPDFLAKTQCPGQHSFDKFTIPALLDSVGEDEVDRLLCPVPAVCEYLHRTRDCQPSCFRLLVTVSDPRRAVHSHTLSKWICQVIWGAYVSVLEEQLRFLKVNAHKVRAIATSVLFRKVKSLVLVLKAGTWKSMTIFASFYSYLRDVTHRYLDTFSLGPIVSALMLV